MPNHFREGQTSSSSSSLVAQNVATPENQDIGDWSYYAGVNEENTRSMGTHISDHKPPQGMVPPAISSSGNGNSHDDDDDDDDIGSSFRRNGKPTNELSPNHESTVNHITRTNINDYPRIGLQHPLLTRTKVSSSAISLVKITLSATFISTLILGCLIELCHLNCGIIK